MQTVSNEWKENHNEILVSEGFVELSLDIADPDALADASATDNGAAYISKTPQVVSEVDRIITPYSTLERNLWVLDGTRRTIPTSDISDMGFVSRVLCNEYGLFGTTVPTVTINFTQTHYNLIPGVTIVWGKAHGEYAKQFIVTAYDGENIVARKEVVDNNSTESIVEMDIKGYDRITIAIIKWCLPHHRVRVEEVFVGTHKVYTKAELFGYSHTQRVDPVSTYLPKTEIQFSVDNLDNAYDPYNPNGLSKYLMERQEIKSRYGHKREDKTIEWIKGGTFYLSNWEAPRNGMVANFTARDLLEFLFVVQKESVSEITSRSLYDMAESLLLKADLPLNSDGSLKWYIDESLKEIYTSAPLPIDTMANCLLMIANAGRCSLFQNRGGTLRIEPLSNERCDYTITKFNSYRKPETALSKPIKQIVVKVYSYSIVDGEVKDSTEDYVISTSEKGEVIEIDNPLITDMNTASAVGEWIADYLRNRITVDVNWRPDVRVDVLDVVNVEDDYEDKSMIMTDLEFNFNGSFNGSGEGRVV